MIVFCATKNASRIIERIVKRAIKMRLIQDNLDSFLDSLMDIEACHCNGNKLRLQAFLDSNEFNFTHDFCGIKMNIDRTTGKITGDFLPRFTKKQMSIG